LLFYDLGLRAELLRALREMKYSTPTPIQSRAIPALLKGRDVLGAAQTGTGKTAGFALPILHRLSEGKNSGPPTARALILVPTRELAAQVHESFRAYGAYLNLRSVVIFGGVGMTPQIQQLQRNPDIVVATPGRLLDLASRGHIDLSHVETLVLDEADRMLDMGFIHDIRRVFEMLPPRRQNALFSATFDKSIEDLASGFLHRPQRVRVAARNATVDAIDQIIFTVDRRRKTALLAKLIHDGDWSQVLVFIRTKHGANRLVQKLGHNGITAAAIHGNKSQSARTRALADFKTGKICALVATEVAARGLDIDGLPNVVNFELPFVAQDYVHRIGRTGRAGAAGQAVSLVCIDETELLRDVEHILRRPIKARVYPGFEPDPNAEIQPLQRCGGWRKKSQSHVKPNLKYAGKRQGNGSRVQYALGH
jgi:ATP-dependent RNA helicase RhlE